MKNRYFTLVLFILATGLIQAQRYTADTLQSTIYWKGFKPMGSQSGTLKLKNGYLTVKDGKPFGGSFVIDMNSMVCTSIPKDDESNQKLINHLKSEDFFETGTYPYATFILTGSTDNGGTISLSGNLLMKGQNKPVKFNAEIDVDQERIRIKSEAFKIDRSEWNIKYKSKSFFSELKDNFIYDDIEIKLDLILKRL